jgi:hypothetical protein
MPRVRAAAEIETVFVEARRQSYKEASTVLKTSRTFQEPKELSLPSPASICLETSPSILINESCRKASPSLTPKVSARF